MDEKKRLLTSFLRRVATGGSESALESASGGKEVLLKDAQVRSQAELEAALEGWRHLEADGEVEGSEVDALEAIVLPLYRPAIDVLNDSFGEAPEPWGLLNLYRTQVESAIRSIGRIELAGHPWIPYAGTGFIVGPNLLLTNRHVAELFILGLGQKNLLFYPGRTSAIDFKQEVVPSEPVPIRVRSARVVHPYWDSAVLEVEGLSGRRPLNLAAAEPPDLVGRRVVAVGYPAMDMRNDAALQNRIFRGVYGRKRLQPGTVMGYGKVKSYKRTVEALTHDCSTLGGNSGSAIVDLETGHVLGLHFAGLYLKANYAVPSWELARDPRLVDLGLEFTVRGEVTAAADGPEWLGVWNSVESVMPAPPAGAPSTTGGASGTPQTTAADGEKYLRVGADWFERTSDAELAIALREDPLTTRALLERTLTREEAAEVIDSLAVEPEREGLFWNDPDPELPEIVFLHGILGGHLAQLGWMKSRVWLFPLSFIRGDLGERLSLSADGESDARSGQSLQPDGHLRLAYSRAARLWRRGGFVVHEFSFDWRKGIALAADRLHFFIESLHIDRPGRKFVLAAHSMGGLVAALYAQRHGSWADRVQRAVLMGVPLGGSYAPVEAVIGSYPFLRKLAFISRRDDVESLRRMARTQPGLIDMLPNPRLFPDAEQMYSQARWPDEVAPSQRWLDQSRNLKSLFLQSPLLERTTLLVSLGHGTVSSLVEQEGSIWRGPRTGVGDGTVPAKAAAVEGVPAYKVDYEHSNIPRDPKAIQAVSDLVKTGACALERVRPEELSGDIVLPEVPATGFPEGLAESVRTRFDAGVFGQSDWDWLTGPEMSSLPKA